MSKWTIGNERGSWSLIGLLITVVIGLVLVLMFVGPRTNSGKGGPNTTPGKAMEMAKDTECKSNVQQIRSAIVMYRNEHEAAPASLGDVQLGTRNPEFLKCPVGHEPYVYDAAAGTIHCPHPGHENY
jgi:hypothetical protein